MTIHDKLPNGNKILNPDLPDANWDISGLFNFDTEIIDLINMCHYIFNCDIPIKSVHGNYPVLWNSGRISPVKTSSMGCKGNEDSLQDPESIIKMFNNHNISTFLTCSNHLLKPKHLIDESCNWLLWLLSTYNNNKSNGVIISSDILSEYIKIKYPELKQKASIVKIASEQPKSRDLEYYLSLEDKFDFIVIHPDDNFNTDLLNAIAEHGNVEKYEILVNENCVKGCPNRKAHYTEMSEQSLTGWNGMFHFYEYSEQFELGGSRHCGIRNYFNFVGHKRTIINNCNLSIQEIKNIYNMGYRLFKVQGRDGSWKHLGYNIIRYIFEPDQIVPLITGYSILY